MVTLEQLDDDTLIYVFSFLSIPNILLFGQVSRRIYAISKQRIVWHYASTFQITGQGIPFRSINPADQSAEGLRSRVKRAYKIGSCWRSEQMRLDEVSSANVSKAVPVEDIRFLPGFGERFVVVASKGIWSTITLWDTVLAIEKCRWAPRKAIFNGLAVNTDPSSVASLAVSVQQDGVSKVELLGIDTDVTFETVRFRSLNSVDTHHRPITLKGELLALADNELEAVIWNCRDNSYATLRTSATMDGWQDKCLQILFCYNSILVVRARSIHLFQEPELRFFPSAPIISPIVSHSFGWPDGIAACITPQSSGSSSDILDEDHRLSILVRRKSADPWSTHHLLQLWTLERQTMFDIEDLDEIISANSPSGCPYAFPPVEAASLVSPHSGPLHCTNMVLGAYGSAVWVQPADRASTGLLSDDVHLQAIPVSVAPQSLAAGLFPGLLKGPEPESRIHCSYPNTCSNWSCLDYDETSGRVALGSTSGSVTVLRLSS